MKKLCLTVCFFLIGIGIIASTTLKMNITNVSLFDSITVLNPLLDSGINVKIANSVIRAGESNIITVTYDNTDINKKFNLEFKKAGYDAIVKCQIKRDYFGRVGIAYLDKDDLDNGDLAGDINVNTVYDKDINIFLS